MSATNTLRLLLHLRLMQKCMYYSQCSLSVGRRYLHYNVRTRHEYLSVPLLQEINDRKRLKSSLSEFNNEIGSSSTLLEDNLSFQEVPLLVKKTNDIDNVHDTREGRHETTDALLESEAIAKVVQVHIVNSTNLSEVLRYLKLVPTNNVSPSLALTILERVTSLLQDENASKAESQEKSQHELQESAVTHALCKLICRSDNHGDVLAGLATVASLSVLDELKKQYLDIFVNECLHRISEGKFSLIQICDLVEAFQKAGAGYSHLCDNLWSEVVGRVAEISEENINRVFDILHHLKASRNVVLRALERLTLNLMPTLKENNIVHILQVLSTIKAQSRKILNMSSVWLTLNIHQITEKGLRDFLILARVLNHMDPKVQQSIEKYIRLKGSRCSDSLLMASLAEYLTRFRWRNETCLEGIADYFVKNYKDLTTYNILSFIEMFGFLNYEPNNAYKVFEVLEAVLSERFSEFEPDVIISIMLACVQLQRYPLNFVSKILRPLFLDRMNYTLSNNQKKLRNAFTNLKLLDTALTLECAKYSGPHMYLPKENYEICIDARLRQISKRISFQLGDILGGLDKFGTSVIVPKLQLSHLYIIDFLIYTNKDGQPIPFNSTAGIDKSVAVLIHLPEHFCHEENHLIGPQAMRIRHLQLLGYQIVCLEHSILDSLCKLQEKQQQYLREHLSRAITCSSV